MSLITLATVKVFPEPVTPSKVWCRLPAVTVLFSFAIACARGPGAGDREAEQDCDRRQSAPDLAGCDGLGEDLYRSQCDQGHRPTDAGDLAQQDARRAALLGVQAVLPGERRR